jgi:hypothetical protein
MPKPIILGIDFDGVVCKHAKFPSVGKPVPGSDKWIKRFDELGARQFLWTCRNDKFLKYAISNIKKRELPFESYNELAYGKGTFAPYPKLFANIYIDDAAFGAPLIFPEDGSRAYLDWDIVGPAVEARIINNQRKL